MSNNSEKQGLMEPLYEMKAFKTILAATDLKKSPVYVSGMIDSQKCHVIAAAKQVLNIPVLIITYSELKAKEIYEDMCFFIKGEEKVRFYPSKDIIFYSADVKSGFITKQRFDAVHDLINGGKPVVVLSVEALFDRLSPKSAFEKNIIHLAVGDEASIQELIQKLVFIGYERRDLVEGTGQFSVRGGIVDIFTTIYENPVRIEFFGDEIDSIRVIDGDSQRSVDKKESITIFPMRELVYNEERLASACKKMEAEYKKTLTNFEKKGLYEEADQLKNAVGQVIETLKAEKNCQGADRFIQYFYEEDISLVNYFPQSAYVFFDEPARIRQKADTAYEEFSDSMKNRLIKGYLLPSQMNMIFTYNQILLMCDKFSQVLLNAMMVTMKDFKPKELGSFNVKGTAAFQNRVDLLIDDMNFLRARHYGIVILSGNRLRGERMVGELIENGINARFYEKIAEVQISVETVAVVSGSLKHGFEYEDNKLAFISDKELFGDKKKPKRFKKHKNGRKIDSFTDLKQGDYIVHENHGIGIFAGIENIVTDNVRRDYLKLTYADGGNLYVPTSQMDMVQKYIGGDSAKPKMSKLGGLDWGKAKARARGAVAILAKDLIDLYAKREAAIGFQYSKDTVWQKEFEETFPFEETDDQTAAIEDVKQDMESSKVMDRLICGDVGYGKTEVALRAAFKAVLDGKQVAYLVPTTILAQQHYATFSQRMQEFPVTVEMMSRFRTPKQVKETVRDLEKGATDIVIGTHRILSKDVRFKDLGLVIVDEEQRFGVSHKERLKHLKENVDVMTLTATPIPRTLHMSLTGIRDMSVLDEPPQERKPIQTYVMEYNQEFIIDAIHRELSRGGQVYYLYNRVRSIPEMAARIQNLVPDANVAYAHGQMSEKELENMMLDFINGDINVLVCTTIIETGLDIPNVNTIIIHDADKYGLAQLYQLRGRVGRSSRIAYCYLMYRKDKVLTEVAEKRLQTVRDFTEFGSGFKISMRDLEIRGAGNLLGESQHGHMDSVGYDMYCKLLNEAVLTAKGEAPKEVFETAVDVNISAFIPRRFIGNEEQKLEIYKKISLIKDKGDLYDVQDEITDRYGDLPASVSNLLDIAYMKAMANDIGVISITQKQNNIVITFRNDAKADPVKITEIVGKSRKLQFTASTNPYMIYRAQEEITEKDIDFLTKMFETVKIREE